MKLNKILLQLSIVIAALLATMAAADMEIEVETEDEIDDADQASTFSGKTF